MGKIEVLGRQRFFESNLFHLGTKDGICEW